MTSGKTKIGGSSPQLQGAALLVLSTLVYIGIVVFAFYTFETAYYIPAKKDIVMEKMSHQGYIDFKAAGNASVAVASYARQRYQNPNGKNIPELAKEAQKQMDALLASSPEIVEVAVLEMGGEVLLASADPSRIRSQHNFSNSIFTRSFVTGSQQTITTIQNREESVAIFRVQVTTALNDPEMEAVTQKYQLAILTFFVVVTLGYYFILRYIIFPLARVLKYLENKISGGSEIIPNPKTQLERAYNNLARDATLTRFSKELRDSIGSEGLSHVDPVLQRIPELLQSILQLEGSQILSFIRNAQDTAWMPEKIYGRELQWLDRPRFQKSLEELLGVDDAGQRPNHWTPRTVRPDGDSSKAYFCEILSATDERLVLFIVHRAPLQHDFTPWWEAYYTRIAQELRYAISSVEEQRRMILAEKSKANISLSRNLGHDLTNIIATSKLELMNVQAFLSLKPEDVANSPRKQKLFQESLEALLNNTRFLQEIVNLYRSFSYLQKPKFEEIGISDLVRDVTLLYQLSISKRIKVVTDLDDEAPTVRVEPRLLRLALFNILTNASDAMKRATSVENAEGTITIRTRVDNQKDFMEIVVEDTGPGLCDKDGTLLTTDQLSEIFQLGYTTKANQEGEGLGLNWVQTIVHDFHGGDIAASNRPEGGASFTIRLPRSADIESRLPVIARPATSDSRNLQEV